MNKRSRERINKVLVRAFLRSDLTTNEIHELAEDILKSPVFLRDFSALLRDVLRRLQKSGPRRKAIGAEEFDDFRDAAYSAIQRRRLSKEEVLNIMDMTVPGAKRRVPIADMPMREILTEFFATASAVHARRFLAGLNIKPIAKDDLYLRGIIRK